MCTNNRNAAGSDDYLMFGCRYRSTSLSIVYASYMSSFALRRACDDRSVDDVKEILAAAQPGDFVVACPSRRVDDALVTRYPV